MEEDEATDIFCKFTFMAYSYLYCILTVVLRNSQLVINTLYITTVAMQFLSMISHFHKRAPRLFAANPVRIIFGRPVELISSRPGSLAIR